MDLQSKGLQAIAVTVELTKLRSLREQLRREQLEALAASGSAKE